MALDEDDIDDDDDDVVLCVMAFPMAWWLR